MGNNTIKQSMAQHLNANSIMGFDLLIKVGKTLAFNKSHPRENSELLLSVRCVVADSLSLSLLFCL